MTDLAEIERRILYALERIGSGLERLPAVAAVPGESIDVEVLQAELEAERATNAQLSERVRAIKEKQETVVATLERKAARLAEQLDEAAAALERQRRLNGELAAANRRLTDEARAGLVAPATIDAALATEVEVLRAERAGEMAEMAGILAELRPLIGEVA
jgi:chromosome segregation ATPase